MKETIDTYLPAYRPSYKANVEIGKGGRNDHKVRQYADLIIWLVGLQNMMDRDTGSYELFRSYRIIAQDQMGRMMMIGLQLG